MAYMTCVLKLPNAAPELVCLNFDTRRVRLAPKAAQSSEEERRNKMHRAELKLAAVETVDSLTDGFCIFSNNIVLLHQSLPQGLMTIGFQPVGFFGLFRSSTGAVLFRTDAVVDDLLPSDYGEEVRNMLIQNVAHKSAEAAGTDVTNIVIKHAFIWLHPRRVVQVLLVTEDRAIIWASLDCGTSVMTASRPHGSFEPMADGITWSVTFHFEADTAKMMTTTLRRMAEGPPEQNLSFHCTVGGAHKSIKWDDVQVHDTWPAVADWAVCAVKFK
jgi:hypothetical protein